MIRKWLCIAAVFMLAGCQSVPLVQGPGDRDAWQARHARLLKIHHWHLQGRAGSTGLFGWSGNLDWHQKDGRFDIVVSGPLGMGGMKLDGTLDLVRIRKDGKTYYTRHPNRFLKRNLGVALPVKGLRYWTLGVPVPDEAFEVRVDNKGRVVKMQQEHWKLVYRNYTRAGGYMLPGEISARRGDVHLKMIIAKWKDVR